MLMSLNNHQKRILSVLAVSFIGFVISIYGFFGGFDGRVHFDFNKLEIKAMKREDHKACFLQTHSDHDGWYCLYFMGDFP